MCTKSELKIVLQEVENASKQLYGDKLNKIILYGSYARGDNTEESDIDIMIILDGDIDDVKKMRSLFYLPVIFLIIYHIFKALHYENKNASKIRTITSIF